MTRHGVGRGPGCSNQPAVTQVCSLEEVTLPDPLPIVADVPSQDPGLGFSEYVEALADAIRGGEPPQFTIGLYGAWGSGKSSLLAALARTLSPPGSGVLPVLFDAWRYERVDHIVVPLLHRICDAASNAGETDLAKTFRRALGALIGSLKFNVGAVSIDPSSGKAAWDGSALAPLDAAFSQPFAELQEVPKALKGTRIAVLIDDLDRCSPENVVTVLEAINLVMDVPGIIFVLALDYDVLVDAVASRYRHVSGHAFVEKIIQLPFRVPPLDVSGEHFLRDLIPNWSSLSKSLPDAVVRCAADIAELGLRRNPRQIKRFVNSFLVIDRIMRARSISVDYELLAAVIALQLAWPEEHRALQDAVFLDLQDPLQTLTAKVSEDQALGVFLARFMTSESFVIEELRTVLQLTAVVVASPPDDQRLPLPGPADQVRETHRQRLLEQLEEDGFEPSSRSAALYYNAHHPDVRFHFRKHNLNFERRSGDRWLMEQQYLLTRELEEALEAITASGRGSEAR